MSQPDRPTALFVWSDEVAFACMALFKEMGLRVPEDVSLVVSTRSRVATGVLLPLRASISPYLRWQGRPRSCSSRSFEESRRSAGRSSTLSPWTFEDRRVLLRLPPIYLRGDVEELQPPLST